MDEKHSETFHRAYQMSDELKSISEKSGFFPDFGLSSPGSHMRNLNLSTYNVSYFYMTDFEKNFDGEIFVRILRDYQWVVYPIVAIYICVIFGLQRYMRDRPAYNLQKPLFLWNFALAVFSMVLANRSLTEMFFMLRNYGLAASTCLIDSKIFHQTAMLKLYAFLFTMSKVVELGDTLFLVLRKRKLTLLHWYHHSTVLLYCWYSTSQMDSTGRMFTAMNSFVHAIMYTYFFIAALNIKIPRRFAMMITCCQLSQMFFGTFFNVLALLVKRAGNRCDVPYGTIYMSLIMYISYVVLFTNFFIEAYVNEKKRHSVECVKKNN